MKRIALILSAALTAAGFYVGSQGETRIAAQTATPTPTATVAATAAPAAAAKPTPPTLMDDENTIIKVDTELVNLNVRVVDRNNRTINNVPETDFKIFEDGIAQKIDFFSKSEVPANYALVIDNSGSLRQQLDKVIEAGKVFVGSNRPEDETMVIRFVGRDKIEIEQPFTKNKTDLQDALDNLLIEGGQTAVIDAVYLAVENVDEYERSKKLDERKRRAIVLVTDGEDRNSFYSEKQLMELLRESEVQIYVIGFVDDLSKDGGFIAKSPQEKSKAFLERIAAESGGKAYFPASAAELPNLAREISNELRTQYSIGYIPSNDRKDGTFRSIKVQVTDGPNTQKRIAVTRAGRTADAAGSGSAKEPPKPTPVKNP
jgi:Ca-activated chloride channel family protein